MLFVFWNEKQFRVTSTDNPNLRMNEYRINEALGIQYY